MHNDFARRMSNDPACRMTTHSAFARTIEIRGPDPCISILAHVDPHVTGVTPSPTPLNMLYVILAGLLEFCLLCLGPLASSLLPEVGCSG